MGHTTENPAQARRLPSFAILLLPLAKQVLVARKKQIQFIQFLQIARFVEIIL
jgi:hypothetical protein